MERQEAGGGRGRGADSDGARGRQTEVIELKISILNLMSTLQFFRQNFPKTAVTRFIADPEILFSPRMMSLVVQDDSSRKQISN